MSQIFTKKIHGKSFQEGKTSLDRTLDDLTHLIQRATQEPNSIDGRTIIADSLSPDQIKSSGILAPEQGTTKTLVISSGAITVPVRQDKFTIPFYIIDTEGAASTDDLDTINHGGIQDGSIIILRKLTGARTPTIRHLGGGTGNVQCENGADFIMGDTRNLSVLVYRGLEEQWFELVRNRIYPEPRGADLTIATGVITIPRPSGPRAFHAIVPESGTVDSLASISGGLSGLELVLRVRDIGDTITVVDNAVAGMFLAGDFVMNNNRDTFSLIEDGGAWMETSRSNNV